MITAYSLFDYTGFHNNSRSRWLQKHFALNSEQARSYQITLTSTAVTHLIQSRVRINDELLTKLRSEINNPSEVILAIPEQFKDTLKKIGVNPDAKIVEEEPEFILFTKSCEGCVYMEGSNNCQCSIECKNFRYWMPAFKQMEKPKFVPEITMSDYEILLDSFRDVS